MYDQNNTWHRKLAAEGWNGIEDPNLFLRRQSETPAEKAKRIGVPLVPRRPKNLPVPKGDPTNPTISICGECGIEIKVVMHYACGIPNCPCGLGPSRMMLNEQG